MHRSIKTSSHLRIVFSLFGMVWLLSACSDPSAPNTVNTEDQQETELVTDGDLDVNDPVSPILIANRASNQSCLAGEAPADPVYLERIFEDISLRQPIHMQQAPGGNDTYFYVAEKNGRVVAIPANDDVVAEDSVTALQLDVLTWGESGITGFAFHPEFATNGHVYISYGLEPAPDTIEHRLSKFSVLADGVSLGNEQIILSMPKDNAEHFGGALAFGPDGFLYYSIGDDGDNLFGDTHPLLAQDPNSLYGAILRIDIDNPTDTRPYSIPTDNPLLNDEAPNEVWAQGFRNPWRMSFDREAPHTLWSSDVGAREVEEINRTTIGENHGWPSCEGPCDPADSNFVDPVYSYSNIGGAASIGGFVYRGANVPELYGKYLFSDYVYQEIYTLDPELLPNEPMYVQTILSVPFRIAGFAQDNAGEVYALDISGGGIYRFSRNEETDQNGPAELLSETGCFASLENGDPAPAAGVIDYATNQKFWSDGADKRRQIALPDGEVIDTSNPASWQIPVGGVTIKHFTWQDKIIETRFLVRHDEEKYGGYTYQWNEEQTDATLVGRSGAKREIAGDLVWEYPSRSNCMRCHLEQAGYTLSLESRQLNLDVSDADVNAVHNQIDRMSQSGYLDSASPEKQEAFPSVKDLTDASIPLEKRAASWLHVNCSSCHQGPGSAGRATWDARYDTSFADRRLCDTLPFEPVSGMKELEALLAPGSHDYSTLWLRASARDTPFAMPPISSTRVDEVGVALLSEWINSLDGGCPPLGDVLPGRVQAQDYEQAFDLTAGNLGNSVSCDKGDDVDLETTADVDGECSISLTDPGEWLEYEVHVEATGVYSIALRAASGASPNDQVAEMQIRLGDKIIVPSVPIPNNGWQTFNTVEIPDVALEAGNHVLRLTFTSGFVNLNYFDVLQ